MERRKQREGLVMMTREQAIKEIMTLPDDAFEKIVTIIESVKDKDTVTTVSDEEIMSIANETFDKYDDAFAKLAK